MYANAIEKNRVHCRLFIKNVLHFWKFDKKKKNTTPKTVYSN